jgi:3-oxoadipate enol-lactonase
VHEIMINGMRLAYTDDGPRDAPALVFSHSLFFSSRMFHHQVAYFSDRYRVICYDHRGQGASDRAPREELDMDTLNDDAAGLLEHLDLGPAHFAGNSMGGFIALRRAARRPELLASVAVLGSSAEAEGKIAEFDPLAAAMTEHGTGPVIDTLMWIMLGDETLAAPRCAAQNAEWREWMLNLDRGIGDCAYQVIHRKPVLGNWLDAPFRCSPSVASRTTRTRSGTRARSSRRSRTAIWRWCRVPATRCP